jgi:hypothetical protein
MATESPLKSDFDLDFRFGSEGEQLVNDLLTQGKTVEVKRDRKWHSTGNIYIECQCYYLGTESWKDSGLLTSKASYWAFVLNKMVVLVTFDDLVKTVAKYGKRVECKIEPNYSRGYLITMENLLETAKESK